MEENQLPDFFGDTDPIVNCPIKWVIFNLTNSMDKLAKQKKKTAWQFTFPQLCTKESLETAWRSEGCYSPEWSFIKKPTVYMPGHTNRESYKKQTSSDLKDLLIPRQNVSASFKCLTIHFIFILIHSFSSQTYILLMHKKQASLFVAYKGQLFTNHCQKSK